MSRPQPKTTYRVLPLPRVQREAKKLLTADQLREESLWQDSCDFTRTFQISALSRAETEWSCDWRPKRSTARVGFARFSGCMKSAAQSTSLISSGKRQTR